MKKFVDHNKTPYDAWVRVYKDHITWYKVTKFTPHFFFYLYEWLLDSAPHLEKKARFANNFFNHRDFDEFKKTALELAEKNVAAIEKELVKARLHLDGMKAMKSIEDVMPESIKPTIEVRPDE